MVEITSPTNGSTVSGTVSISANASDNVGVYTLEIYVDIILEKTATSSSQIGELVMMIDYDWVTTGIADGSYEIKVIAYDATGNEDFETLAIDVDNSRGGG